MFVAVVAHLNIVVGDAVTTGNPSILAFVKSTSPSKDTVS